MENVPKGYRRPYEKCQNPNEELLGKGSILPQGHTVLFGISIVLKFFPHFSNKEMYYRIVYSSRTWGAFPNFVLPRKSIIKKIKSYSAATITPRIFDFCSGTILGRNNVICCLRVFCSMRNRRHNSYETILKKTIQSLKKSSRHIGESSAIFPRSGGIKVSRIPSCCTRRCRIADVDIFNHI
jgi:hypothetical protein